MNNNAVDAKQLRRVLREQVEAIGGQAAWARKHGISEQYVSDLLLFNKPISPKIARCLGYERTYVYLPRGARR